MILAISSESKQKYFSEKQKGGVVYKITNGVDGKFYNGLCHLCLNDKNN